MWQFGGLGYSGSEFSGLGRGSLAVLGLAVQGFSGLGCGSLAV